MENERESLWPKFRGFVSFIPYPLKLAGKPEVALLPLNVLIGRYTIRDGKNVLASALYEPDLSSLITDERESLVMNYYNRYNRSYFLKMIIEKGCKERICQKYREKEKIGSTYGTIDWAKQDESWYNFFQHVGLLGLDKGEGCDFLEI